MSPDKGAHRAVTIALEAGLPLKIAGKCAEPAEQAVLRRPRPAAPRRRPRVRRRGQPRREGRAAPARARDRLPDLVAGAVRARDDRVDGLRDARDRDPLGRRARGDRPRSHRDHRRRLAADGGRARRTPTRSTRQRCGATWRSTSRPSGWSRTTSQRTRPPSRRGEAPVAVRRRDPQARPSGAGRARGRAALPPRRYGDRRAPRPAAAGRARSQRGGLTALFGIFNFLQYGTTAQVGRASGAGQEQAARRLGAQALWLCLASGSSLPDRLGSRSRRALVELLGARRRRRRLRRLLPADRVARAPLRVHRARRRRATCAASPTCGLRS